MSDPYSKAEPNAEALVAVGTLYVVATPIGNLADMSYRAVDVLRAVDLILAEDTRHSKRLLSHYGISNALRSCHEHNELELIKFVSNALRQGQSMALISDAGTPLISDPGFVLVRALRDLDLSVCAVPGASAITAALSVAGLPTDSFVYDGFLPSKQGPRKKQLQLYLTQSRTAVLLESSHRIAATLQNIVEVLGADREVVIARELTKKFETVLHGTASKLVEILEQDPHQSRGEFVLMLKGVEVPKSDIAEIHSLLNVLLSELPLKQAAKLTAEICDRNKNEIYQIALELKQRDEA